MSFFAKSLKMYKIFLETHNLNNLHTGFGQFNLHILKALEAINDPELQFTIHAGFKDSIKKEFGSFFKYKIYFGARRYKLARIKSRYDVWHSLNQNTKIEPYRDIPYVLTIHDVNFINEISNDPNHKRNLRFKEKLNKAHAITYISEFAKKSTHKHFKIPSHIPEHIVYNGNPTTGFLNLENFKPNVDTTTPYFFAIGDFRARKNFHVLVEMMANLPNYNLIIAGNNSRSYGETVKKRIEDLNLQNRVTLVGRISEEEKQYYLKHASAFVFPSLNEGFGLPIIEAMKFGIPVMLANTSSLPEIGGKYAFYWEELTPKPMAEKLVQCLKEYESNKEFYKQKYIERANMFTWENATKQYIEIYKQVIENAKRSK